MLKKILFPAILTSGAVLCSFSVLIAALGSKTVDIRVENDQVVASDLRNLFSPQMATFLSLGAGITTAAMIGWSYCSRKSSEVEQQLSSVQETISDTDSQIETLKQTPGERVDSRSATILKQQLQVMQTSTVQPMVMSTSATIAQPLVVIDGILTPEIKTPSQPKQKATSLFSSVQSVLGLTQGSSKQNYLQVTSSDESLDIVTSVQKLYTQAQQMHEQLQLLEKAVNNKTQQLS